MRDLCLDEGTLQSYCDEQLAPEMLEQVRSHLSSCSACTEVVREIESEMNLATSAFAAEMSLSVPSERLRNRLDHAIAGLSRSNPETVSILSRVRAWVTSTFGVLNFTPQRAFGFASLVAFIVLAAVVAGVVMQQRDSSMDLNIVAGKQYRNENLAAITPDVPTPVAVNVPVGRPSKRRSALNSGRPSVSAPASDNVVNLAHRPLPGEKNYLQAISLLTDAIETNGEASLKPTLLADYKRNLEVVNEAIKATQRTARTNPKSPDAAEMLFSVYQSKLDLLSAVAEQSRPMIAQR